jgi:hypothetical protein
VNVLTLHPLAADLKLGMLAEWVAALGTVGAFWATYGLLRKELAARREQEEDRRREQARRAAAWTLPVPRRPDRHVLVMHNGSEEPVYAITLVMEHPDQPGTVTREESWDYLPPEERSKEPYDHAGPPGPITLTFTDAAGRRWTRHPDGRLVEPERPARRSRKDYMNAWIAGELEHLGY